METHWLDRSRNIVVVPLILAALTAAADIVRDHEKIAQLEVHATQQPCSGGK